MVGAINRRLSSVTSSAIRISFETISIQSHLTLNTFRWPFSFRERSVKHYEHQSGDRAYNHGLVNRLGPQETSKVRVLCYHRYRKFKLYDMMYQFFIYNFLVSMCIDYSLQLIIFSILNIVQVRNLALFL